MEKRHPAERVKLIFNPMSGRAFASAALLQQVLTALQALHFIPEVYLTEAGGDLKAVIAGALRREMRLFVVCGGDGTVEAAAQSLLGKRATLGIIPTGTHNNIALSLGIPTGVQEAAALLRSGQRRKIDAGLAKSGGREIAFLEVCSIGLFSAIFSSAEGLQKGDLTGLGKILSTLASFPLADIQLQLDEKQTVRLQGHVALVSNLPYFGMNYLVSPDGRCDDGKLDVLVFTEFSKLELVGNVLQTGDEGAEDHRLRRYRAQKVEIRTTPAMPVQVDGTALGETPVVIRVQGKALSVVTGLASQRQPPRWGFLRNLNPFRFLKP